MIATANDPSIRVRIPKRMMERIVKLADRNSRSVNSEILQRLVASLTAPVARRQPRV
jgi:Arc-like DNA binding domain